MDAIPKIKWEGDPAPEMHMPKVMKDLGALIPDLDEPGDLIFHHISLSEDESGPSVIVWGKEGVDHFFAEFSQTTKWESLKGADLND